MACKCYQKSSLVAVTTRDLTVVADDYINFDNKDIRIYFHLICLAIIGIAGYYLYMNLFLGGLSSELNDLLDMFE